MVTIYEGLLVRDRVSLCSHVAAVLGIIELPSKQVERRSDVALHHQLPWLELHNSALFIHNVVKGLVTELLNKVELLESPDLYLSLSYFSPIPNILIKNLFFDFK